MAYVRFPLSKAATFVAPLRAPNSFKPSWAAETGAGRAGSVTSMICTPSSLSPVTMAYVRSPLPKTATSCAPPKVVNPPTPSWAAETGTGRAGSVTSMIWKPLSS